MTVSTQTGVSPGRQLLLERWWVVGVGVAATVAVLVRLPRRWTPLGDNALVWMWTDAVGTGATPLVGGDARFGWNHLGPWLFYLLALPYRLLGGSPVGLLLGAGAINVICLVLILRCVRDLAGHSAAASVGVGLMLFLLTASGDRLIDPWNPWIAQLPLLLALVATWAVLNGRVQWLPWVAGTASLCVQCHIAFIVPAAVLVIAAVVGTVRCGWSTAHRDVRRALIVLAVAWLPSLIDLALPHRHNLFRVARWFAGSSSGQTAGIPVGVDVVLHETGLGASWMGGRIGTYHPLIDSYNGSVGHLPGLGLLFLAAAATIAYRRRQRLLGTLVVLLAVLLVAGASEMALARGPLYPYLFGWVSLAGMMCWVAGFLTIASRFEWSPRRASGIATAVAVGAAVALVVVGVDARTPRSPLEGPHDAALVRQLVAQAEPKMSRNTPWTLVHGGDAYNSIYELGITAALRADGYHVVVGRDAVVVFGRHMIDAHAAEHPQIRIESPFESAPSNAQIIALSDPLNSSQRAREAFLVQHLSAAYQSAGNPDAAQLVAAGEGNNILFAGLFAPDPALDGLLQELATLRAHGRSVAIVTLPPGATFQAPRQ